MSQIPRRTNLSLTQPPKARKTPTSVSPPTASQPMMAKRTEGETPRAAPKTIEIEAPILIDDNSFGDVIDNDQLIQVLSSVEEKNGNGVHHKATEEAAKPKESRRSKKDKKTSENNGANLDDDSSSSVRTSVDSSSTIRQGEEAPLEMESLLIPDEDDELVVGRAEKSTASSSTFDSPRPNRTPGGTKIVRLAKGMRLSPFRKNNGDQQPLDNVSTIVNLSTVSEQSVENQLDSPVVAVSGKNAAEDVEDEEEETNGTSGGASRPKISARRTFATNRPLREMSFRNATREAYKKLGEEEETAFATVNDSVNATVGSELGLHLDDLPETPAAGQKRRRNQDEDGSDAEEEEGEGEPEAKKSFLQTYCSVM